MANRLDARTVELTDAETVVKEWYDALLDNGMSPEDAIYEIETSVPHRGATWSVLQDRVFWEYLAQ